MATRVDSPIEWDVITTPVNEVETRTNGEAPDVQAVLTASVVEEARQGIPPEILHDLAANSSIKILLSKKIRVIVNGRSEELGLPPMVADLIAEYLIPPNLIHWHTALERLGLLPKRIPRLSGNIYNILHSPCPIRHGEKKADGTPYKVSDTHLLYLLPPGTLNELAVRARTYAEQQKEFEEENPFKFLCHWDVGNSQCNEAQWVLLTEDILPGSILPRNTDFNLTCEKQAQMVAIFKRQIPSLRAAVGVAFLHKIATGKSILKQNNVITEMSNNTLVNNTQNNPLIVGSFGFFGLKIVTVKGSSTSFGVAGMVEGILQQPVETPFSLRNWQEEPQARAMKPAIKSRSAHEKKFLKSVGR